MAWDFIELGEIYCKKGQSIDPLKYKQEVFELYSIPAYDRGNPERLPGSEIGSSKKLLLPNDVVISRIVPHIRRCWIIPPNSSHRQIGSGEWIVFRSNKIFPAFLRYYLLSDIFHVKFLTTVKGVGGSLLRADPRQVAKFKIPLPPLSTQQQIARILDQADDLRKKTQQVIDLYDQLAQSIFLDMFGDPVRNPKGWERKKLSNIIARLGSGKSLNSVSKEHAGDYKVLKTSSVSWGFFNQLESKYLPKGYIVPKEHLVDRGDILMSRMNTTQLVGASAYVHQEVTNLALPDRIWKFIWKNEEMVVPFFIWFTINKPSFRNEISKVSTGTSGSMKNISQTKLLALDIITPPITLQNQFADKISLIEKQKELAKQSLQESENLFNALLQKAFKGELVNSV